MRAWLTALLLVALTALPACSGDETMDEGAAAKPAATAESAPEASADNAEAAGGEMAAPEQPAGEQAAEEQPAEEQAAEKAPADTAAAEEPAAEQPTEEQMAEDTTPVPFGLKWGMQPGDLSDLDIKIKDRTRTGDLTVVDSDEVPNAFADTKSVSMLFDRRLGLVKVRWTSVDIEDDADGTAGRAKYGEMKSMVMGELGKPTDETLVVGARLFDQEDEFYQCLAYEGCGVWSALWENEPSGGVLLSIEGEGPGKGFVQIDYESANWKQAASHTASATESAAKTN